MESEMFTRYQRQEWCQLLQDDKQLAPLHELAKLVSLNDRLSQEDVEAIYLPLVQFIEVKWQLQQMRIQTERAYLHQTHTQQNKVPFIVGISGSVAVGKSTTARVLNQLLKQNFPHKQVELMTTDGFLYPTAELERRKLLNRKGFPESYDMANLIDFMVKVRTSSETVKYPVYSHEIYDIIPDQWVEINQPDILIVEGINVLQLPQNQEIYISDFFDLSIYIDANPRYIRQWYMERFKLLLELAKSDRHNYYYPYTQLPLEEAMACAEDAWGTINMVNLIQHIAPTKSRADIIIHKTQSHEIDYVDIKKY